MYGRPDSTITQLYLIDIYGTLNSSTAEYTLFWSARRIFAKIEHILAVNPDQILINLKGLKSNEVCSLFRMELNLKPTTESYMENPPKDQKEVIKEI